MLERVSPDQIDQWEAFNELVPIGTQPLFETLSLLGCTLAAGKGVETKQSHFAPCLERAKREPTSAEQLRELRRDMLEVYGA